MGASVLDRFRLDGKVALVTGGTKGLGRAMAEALASAGASVVLTGRTSETAEAAAREVAQAEGARTLGLGADVSKSAEVTAMVARVLDAFGRLDILVNNAGINIRRPIEKLEESEWEQVIATNLTGPWLCCRAAVEPMRRQKWGRVINVSSTLGQVGLADRTPYCSSKGGLTLMTRTLALEWARDGINVNALCPGPFATEINRPLLDDPVAREAMQAKVPQGRWADPVELGPVAVFLASEASSFVTGATILVDGGYTAQ
jgi:NAD(P)-dependent dehydrogenase (short-subunit alcohol dehydrogenase family)